MKILHIALLSSFTEGMLYQDNLLEQFNRIDGHEVTVITDSNKYVNGVLSKVEEEDIYLKNGTRLIRLNYDDLLNNFVSRKIQKIRRLYGLIESIEPDSILWHGVCGYELINVAKYIKLHPNVLFYMDSHEDFNNTASRLVSKICYKYIHGFFVKKALPYVKKILYVGYDAVPFLKEMYGIPDKKLEFFPLGGIIVPKEEQDKQRECLIKEYQLPKDAIICAHSGKMVKEKRTEELLRAFLKIHDDRLRLFVFGSIPENRKEIIEPLIKNDDRIYFLGWKKNKDILDILAATDLYCQPGTMSATYQNALCAGCATMIRPTDSYKHLAGDVAIYTDGTEENITNIFSQIVENQDFLLDLKEKSYKLAKEKLDYQKLSRRYLN